MALPANIRLKPLNGDQLDANGQGQIQQARPAIQQFLLNVFGAWNHNKPQLFKDVPALDMVTPQVAYMTGQGSAEESMAGFGGPASIRGGLQYGRYGRNTINYGAQQGKQYAAREGQQFIKSQAENIVHNPGKTSTGIPFRGAEIQAPIVDRATMNIKAMPETMAGMKPGSVEPVIPWATRTRVAGIDAKNAVKQGAGAIGNKITAGKNAIVSGVGKAGTPLRDAANFMKPQDASEWKALGVITGGVTGVVGAGAYALNRSNDKQSKPVEQRTAQKSQSGDKNPSNQNSIYPNAPRQSVKPDAKITGNTVPTKVTPSPVITTKTNTTKQTSDGTTVNTSKTTTTPASTPTKGNTPEVRKKESPNVKTTSPVVDKAVQQVAGPKPIPNTSALVDQAEQMEKVNANMPIKSIQAKPLPNRSVGTKILAGNRPQPTHNSTGNFYTGEISLEPNYIPGILNRGVKTQMKCGGILKTKKKKK